MFFCDAHSPWQRGHNENMNGLLRDYFPKGTDLRQVTPEELTRVADEINNRPRKSLAWARPADLLAGETVATECLATPSRHPQKIAVGSRSTSASSSSTLAEAGTRSYSWKLQIAVTPIQRPQPWSFRVAQSRDREPRPLSDRIPPATAGGTPRSSHAARRRPPQLGPRRAHMLRHPSAAPPLHPSNVRLRQPRHAR